MRQWRSKHPENYQVYRKPLRLYFRAATALGIPPILYAAMKIVDNFTQVQETLDGPDQNQSV